MSHSTDLTESDFVAGSTPQIDYTLKDGDGNIITTALATQTATIYDEPTGALLTGWDTGTDIDGANGNTVTAGVGVWDLPPAATAMIGSQDTENHIISINFTYGTGRVGIHLIRVRVHRQ